MHKRSETPVASGSAYPAVFDEVVADGATYTIRRALIEIGPPRLTVRPIHPINNSLNL